MSDSPALPTKKDLKQVGYTITALANEWGLHYQTIRLALRQETPTTGKIRIFLDQKRREAGLK